MSARTSWARCRRSDSRKGSAAAVIGEFSGETGPGPDRAGPRPGRRAVAWTGAECDTATRERIRPPFGPAARLRTESRRLHGTPNRTGVCFDLSTWVGWSVTNGCSPPGGARRQAGVGTKGDADGRGPEREAAADPQLHRRLPARPGLPALGARDRRGGGAGLLGHGAHPPRSAPA